MRTPFHELRPARGTRPTVFGPFEQMGRTPFRLLTAATGAVIILIGILLVALPDATVLTFTLLLAGVFYGYLTYRRRSRSSRVQQLQAIAPVLLMIIFMFLTRGVPFTVAALTNAL